MRNHVQPERARADDHTRITADLDGKAVDLDAFMALSQLFTGNADSLNGASGVRNVKSQVRIARRAYKLYGATRLLRHYVFEGEHRWDGAHAVPWLRKHLV